MGMSGAPSIEWRKSTLSSAQGGNCVELAGRNGRIAIRDSKNPDGPILIFDAVAFGAFLERLR
jgi:uncharacterized protein DUF397